MFLRSTKLWDTASGKNGDYLSAYRSPYYCGFENLIRGDNPRRRLVPLLIKGDPVILVQRVHRPGGVITPATRMGRGGGLSLL